eukprot:TRINITY_DN11278_c0_g1_i2.p1 TRINITY_DN11278_c0_g1~~TRINITY_DN11278_c0_g1_i2.p1  ORF type:complete len:380 (-),score=55.52 TRINITY_DN11278_c0_g1_i2:119-1201(-)
MCIRDRYQRRVHGNQVKRQILLVLIHCERTKKGRDFMGCLNTRDKEAPGMRSQSSAREPCDRLCDFSSSSPQSERKGYSRDSKNDRRYIHWFESGKRRLHLLNLDSNVYYIKDLNEEIDLNVPFFSRSVITPRCEIYLMGGKVNRQGGIETKNLYKFQILENGSDTGSRQRKNSPMSPADELIRSPVVNSSNLLMSTVKLAPMAKARSNFACVYFENGIFVIGGEMSQSLSGKECERYDIATDTWTNLPSLNFERHSASACVLSKRHSLPPESESILDHTFNAGNNESFSRSYGRASKGQKYEVKPSSSGRPPSSGRPTPPPVWLFSSPAETDPLNNSTVVSTPGERLGTPTFKDKGGRV